MNKLKIDLSENISGFFGVKYRVRYHKWEVRITRHYPHKDRFEYFDCVIEAAKYKDDNTISFNGNEYKPNEISGAFKRHKRRMLKFTGNVNNALEVFEYLNNLNQDKKQKIAKLEKRIKAIKRK